MDEKPSIILIRTSSIILTTLTQAAIDARDNETVKRHFRFIDEVFRDVAPDVESAVKVSYLENLRFDGRKAGPTQARGLLPPRLHQALVDLEEYLAKLYDRDGRI